MNSKYNGQSLYSMHTFSIYYLGECEKCESDDQTHVERTVKDGSSGKALVTGLRMQTRSKL